MNRLFILAGLLLTTVSCSGLNDEPLKVAFLGDSQVRNWDLDYWFPYNSNVNYGIPGSTAHDLISELNKPFQADRLVILAGINDIIQLSQTYDSQATVDSVLNCFKIIAGHISTDDIILSVCPVALTFENSNGRPLNSIVSEVNRGIAALCLQKNIKFLDISKQLSSEGALYEGFTQDGLHLNNRGYEIVSKTLRTHLF